MDSATGAGAAEIAFDSPFFRIYKDGRVDRFQGTDTVPPSLDPQTGVQSKDVRLSSDPDLSVRLFLPRSSVDPARKLPLLVYVHGGAFCIESPSSPIYTRHLNAVASAAGVLAVGVQYRWAPEHLLPAAYEDAWAAVRWVAAHALGERGAEAEPWLRDRADFNRVFLAGDSAGANIAQHVAARAGVEGLPGLRIVGVALVHPFFRNDEPDKLMELIFPSSSGTTDPRMNPAYNPNLGRMAGQRAVVFVAEKDHLRERGRSYYEALKKSGWEGAVEIVETEGEGHVFHLFKPGCDKAAELVKKFASFLNQQESGARQCL
ncbi:2-hydroxyisoflavanone dehydratase-like [Syzygium oleosum]|uniref:2-hydroxyisoflavanone dehydratase-like n=1 Tax=Syzygium oleosum TaxID=219896 RepID=UPI0024BAA92F|nr:2-hydroxyisoflavanone dehydratase-like [Syzygium oleosum]